MSREIDDYLPNFTNPPPPKSKPKPQRTAPLVQQPPKPKKPRIDPLVSGLAKADAEIVMQLKPFIERYECRDRVLRALKSVRSKDATLNALKKISESLRQFKAHK